MCGRGGDRDRAWLVAEILAAFAGVGGELCMIRGAESTFRAAFGGATPNRSNSVLRSEQSLSRRVGIRQRTRSRCETGIGTSSSCSVHSECGINRKTLTEVAAPSF